MTEFRHIAKRLFLLLGAAMIVLAVVIGVVLYDTTGGLPVADWTSAHPTTTAQPFVLDLNSANAEELLRLPAMTEELAELIVDYRTRFGRFYTVDALRSLPDVTNELFLAWRPYLTV